jgi:glycosyltransferase involved in cell wall biosynthesis
VKLFHLYANWKWTGPAEPAVNLAAALRDRGHAVDFACGRAVEGLENEIEGALAVRDLRATPGLRLGKHRNPFFDPMDRSALRRILETARPDVLHCHLANDHRIGLGAARGMKERPKVVRSLYDGEVPKVDGDLRHLLGPGCEAALCVSRTLAEALPDRAGVPAEKVFFVEGAVDLERFAPRPGLPAIASEFGLRKDDFVVGIVARMQKHRNFEVFFEAISRVADRVPGLKVLLVGRGTWMDEVAVKPAARKELAGKVIFTGYRRGAEYVETLRCMSAKVFLVPGSDGSCRAVREALAVGVPVVATRRGMLPEIVADGESGFLVEETAEALAEALVGMAKDETLRKMLSKGARDAARARFSLPAQAERVEAIYRWVLGKGQRPPTNG